MTPRERVWAALRGESLDRPPVSFWGHFYERESSAGDLVDATLEFHHAYAWDWVKLNPRKHYHVEPWGVRYRYPGRANEKPVLESWPIRRAEDWSTIRPQPHDRGALGEQIEAVRLLRSALPADVPIIETVFTPLAILGEMVREPQELKSHMATHPQLVQEALEAVTATFEVLVPALLQAGADGIYFATVDWASSDVMNPKEYRQWARAHDLRLIGSAGGAPFNVLHVCKGRNLLNEVSDYPVAAFSWAATDPTNPSLVEALERTPGAVMGGIAHEGPLQESTPNRALDELHRALEQTGGRRWLVAPGCSIQPTTPAKNLRALRDAVEAMRLSPERSR